MGPAADGGGSSSRGRKAGAQSFCDTIAVTAAALLVVVVVSFFSLGLAEAQNPLERPGSQGKRDFIYLFTPVRSPASDRCCCTGGTCTSISVVTYVRLSGSLDSPAVSVVSQSYLQV